MFDGGKKDRNSKQKKNMKYIDYTYLFISDHRKSAYYITYLLLHYDHYTVTCDAHNII